MSNQTTGARHRRRTITRVVGVALLAILASACQGTWGIKSSYRSYVAGPIGHGTITTHGAAGWTDGPGAGKGPFTWGVEAATFDADEATGTIWLSGGVSTKAHSLGDDVYALETSFWNPRLEIDGDAGTLYADLTFRPFVGTAPDPVPSLQSALDVAFATVDLGGVDWTPDAAGARVITDAPMVGIDAAMELIGWDAFYGPSPELDPLTVRFNATTQGPAVSYPTQVTVSETENLRPGDTIAVFGRGFDPSANVGTRPPLAGRQSGNYVVFGRFADVWRPSEGAPSSARPVVSQRWALPESSRLFLDPTRSNDLYVEMDEFGRWSALLTIGAGTATTGSYGVYTYPGGGATNAGHEIAVPVEVIIPPAA